MNDLLEGFSQASESDDSLLAGFDLLPDSTGGSNVERTEEKENEVPGLLSGFSRLTGEDQSTGGSIVERAEDDLGTDDKGFEFVDPFIKTPIALGYGMASWPFAQSARFGAMYGQKAQQALGLVPEMTDEEVTELGHQTAEWFSTLGGALDPKSDIGKSAMELAGKAVEPIVMASHWINSGIDREKYPHLGPLADTVTEGMMFAFLHKFGKESIDIGKRQLKVREKKGQARVRAQKKLEKKQAEVLKKAEEAAKQGELQKIITEYQEAIIPIVKEQSAGQPPSGQKIKTQAERTQAEILARQEASPEQQPGRVAREIERFQEGIIPDRRSLSEQSQIGKGEGAGRRPELGREPQSGMKEVVKPKPTPKPEVTMLTEEGIPRATYQVENGKIKEVGKIGEKQTHQVDPKTGEVKLVESIPGERSVYQILLDPLKNESGSVDIGALKEAFGRRPKAGSLMNQFLKKGLSRDDLMLSGLGSYLAGKGQNKIDWKEFKKIADEGGFEVKRTEMSNTKDVFDPAPMTKYGPNTHPDQTLAGFVPGSYKERIYKYDSRGSEINAIRKEINQGIISPALGKQAINNIINQNKTFKEVHGYPDNTMAHARITDRVVQAKGKDRTTEHINEAQSDWHKKGASGGYGPLRLEVKYSKESSPDKPKFPAAKTFELTKRKEAEKFAKEVNGKVIESYYALGKQTVLNAPFKKTWPEMIMRDTIASAIQSGKEGISWDTAKTIQGRAGDKAKPNRDAIYDKKIKKFMEKESGVKAEKVETEAGFNISGAKKQLSNLKERMKKKDYNFDSGRRELALDIQRIESIIKEGKTEVWYVPITSKLRKAYSESIVPDAIDMLLSPLRNESGAITIPRSRKKLLQQTTPTFRENVRKFGQLAEQAGMPLKEFLKNNDFTNKEIRLMVKVSEAVKLDRPMASAKEMPRIGKKDFNLIKLEKGDTQVNIGKDSNPNVPIGLKTLEKFAQIPRLKSGGLVQGLTVPETFFVKHKSIKPLLHMKRAMDKALAKDTKTLTAVFKDIEKTYPNKKLRKEAGDLQISKGKFGEKALQKMGIKVNPDAKYQGLNAEILPIYQDGLRRINEVRKMNGRKPIKEMEDFIAWFAEENFWRDVKELVGGDFNRQGPSLIHDSIETIRHRHSQPALDMGNFNHVTREGLRDGVKLERDPLVIAQRYMSELLPVIHYAKLNSFIKEAMTKDLTLPNGKKVNFSDKYTGINQGLARELISWSNSLVGKSNSPLPHLVEKQLGRMRRALTNATLVGNLRTTAIQLTALQTSFVERPGRTIQAGFDYMADLGRKKPKFEREKYNSLPDKGSGLGVMDTSFSDATSAIGGTKLQKTGVAYRNTLAWAMKQLDYVAREITARAKESELKKAVKEGRLSEKEMIEQVDSTVVRTQSSGARGEVAPIQRSELGKIMTLWQTFTIGHINWIAKEVLGVKNPEMTPGKTANRVFRYVSTMAILGYVFEDLIGIQAPGPAPIQAVKRAVQGGETDIFKIALMTGRELSELVPFGSSIKFGSSLYGPVADFINKDLMGLVSNTDIYNQDVLAKARKGDVKSILKILEVSGKLKGVPGTAQIAKTARGLLRDESLMRAMIGRIYDENAKGSKTGKKRTSRKRRTKKRSTR